MLVSNQLRRAFTITSFILAIVTISNAASAWQGSSIVLENQLGSADQIAHSDIGPSGAITQGNQAIDYENVKFGKGVHVIGNSTNGNTKIEFPVSRLNGLGNLGTMSFWVRPDHDSDFDGIARWINSDSSGTNLGLGIYWRGWEKTIWFQICAPPYNCTTQLVASVPNSKFSFKKGDIFNVAIVWNRQGIAGSSDRIRAYINGKLMAATAGLLWTANLQLADVRIGASDYPVLATIDELTFSRRAITDWSLLPAK